MNIYSDSELARILDKKLFHSIGEVADEMGIDCYVVGGFVRDIFLGRPSNDIDVVVVGSGIDIATRWKNRLGRCAHLTVYKNFGTAQVVIHPRSNDDRQKKPVEVEFVGARKESYNRNSRKPIVEDGTLEDDQNRRDFTINAMAICLNGDRFGKLIDPFDGLLDLEEGIIATPLDPDITFSDDPLRMMRCVRFATQLNFQIEESTFDALLRNAHRLTIISGERIAEELNKIIMTSAPSRGFIDLYRCGLLQIILPELCQLDIVETRNNKAHKNNFYHTLEVLDNLVAYIEERKAEGDEHYADGCLWLRWAAVFHDIGKPKSKRWDNLQGWTFNNHNYLGAKMIPHIFRRMKFPMDAKMKYVQKLVDLHMRPIAISDEQVTDSAVRRLLNDAGDDIDDLIALCKADVTSKNSIRKAQCLENFRIVQEKIADLKEKDYKRLLQPVIDGNEIMQLFGLKQSVEVGNLKRTLKEAVLDNRVENEREPLLKLLIEKAKQIGLHPIGQPNDDAKQ